MSLDVLLAEAGPGEGVCIPGCYDGFSALLIEQAGFPVAFLTGGGLSMARLGRPDMGLVTASELAECTAQITERISLPLIVDADTGFGNALTLQRTLRQLARAGAAAVTIEDQQFPKRCGHMAGKRVVPVEEAVGRVRAAVDAAGGMTIIARTDALALEGLDAALERAERYLEAGAGALFIEGPREMSDVDEIARRFAGRVPLIHNLVEGGTSPAADSAPFFERGYAATLHPLLLLHLLAAQAPAALAHLRERGETHSFGTQLADLQTMNRLTGADELIKEGDRYA